MRQVFAVLISALLLGLYSDVTVAQQKDGEVCMDEIMTAFPKCITVTSVNNDASTTECWCETTLYKSKGREAKVEVTLERESSEMKSGGSITLPLPIEEIDLGSVIKFGDPCVLRIIGGRWRLYCY